jgi:hypothetical protein
VVLWATGEALWQLKGPLAAAYPPHPFGGSNPADMGRRLASIALTLLALLWVESQRPGWLRGRAGALVETFGTASLSAYVFHQGMLFWHPFKRMNFNFRAFFDGSLDWAEYGPMTALVLALTWMLVKAFAKARAAGLSAWAKRRRFSP